MDLFEEIQANSKHYVLVHYSCESFVDKDDGRTPRITTIAIRYYGSGQTVTFSIHEVAEQNKVPIDGIEEAYDSLEKRMLEQYFEFVEKHEHISWIHWNMRDSTYGFYAIENRFVVLGGKPCRIPDEKKIDLACQMFDCYGRNYIGHPRMKTLVIKNGMTKLGFLSGEEEAEAFLKKEYIRLRNSTLRKVNLFHEIIDAAAERRLETDAKWTEIYGVSIQGIYEALKTKWWFNLLLFVLGIGLGVLLTSFF